MDGSSSEFYIRTYDMRKIIEWDTKICKTCGIEKPIEEFRWRKKWKSHECHCKDCNRKKRRERDKNKYDNNPIFRQSRIENSRRYRLLHPDAAWKTNIKTRYWLSIDDVENIKKLQNYKCYICWASENDLKRWLMIDHSHFTWDIRWMLCDTCNKFIWWYERHADKCNEYLKRSPYKIWSAKIYPCQKIDLKNLSPYN